MKREPAYWETPSHRFKQIMAILSEELDIDHENMIDVCCTEKNKKCDLCFTVKENSLTKYWHLHGQWGWMAVPYNGWQASEFHDMKKKPVQPLFVRKAIEEAKYGFKTISLIQTRPWENWWFHMIHKNENVEYINIVGRFQYEKHVIPEFGNTIAIFGIPKNSLSSKLKEKIELLFTIEDTKDFDAWNISNIDYYSIDIPKFEHELPNAENFNPVVTRHRYDKNYKNGRKWVKYIPGKGNTCCVRFTDDSGVSFKIDDLPEIIADNLIIQWRMGKKQEVSNFINIFYTPDTVKEELRDNAAYFFNRYNHVIY